MAKHARKKRTYRFAIRLSEKEKARFEKIAKQWGVTKSDLIRMALNSMAVNLFDLQPLREKSDKK